MTFLAAPSAAPERPSGHGRSSLPVVAAILGGCGLIAAALYFRRADHQSPLPPASASAITAPLASAPPTPCTTPSASAAPKPPSEVHHPGAFATVWRPHRDAAAQTCKTADHVVLDAKTWYIELPFSLTIDSSGAISAARPNGAPRDVAEDGSYRAVKLQGVSADQLARCYAGMLTESVTFPPSTSGSHLDVWLRVLSTVDR